MRAEFPSRILTPRTSRCSSQSELRRACGHLPYAGSRVRRKRSKRRCTGTAVTAGRQSDRAAVATAATVPLVSTLVTQTLRVPSIRRIIAHSYIGPHGFARSSDRRSKFPFTPCRRCREGEAGAGGSNDALASGSRYRFPRPLLSAFMSVLATRPSRRLPRAGIHFA